ncbi:MAG: hypothetical protein ACRYFS_10625 [Janthinobacterium lividum]
MKLFSTRTHGVLDYSSVVLLCVLPRVMGWSGNVTRLLTGSALITLGYSLSTRYELGPIKVIPMPAHLALDRSSGTALCVAAGVLREEPTSVRLALFGLGLFEITASLTTETQPAREADQA